METATEAVLKKEFLNKCLLHTSGILFFQSRGPSSLLSACFNRCCTAGTASEWNAASWSPYFRFDPSETGHPDVQSEDCDWETHFPKALIRARVSLKVQGVSSRISGTMVFLNIRLLPHTTVCWLCTGWVWRTC